MFRSTLIKPGVIVRVFSLSVANAGNIQIKKQAKMITKMMNPVKKRKWVENYYDVMPDAKSLAKKQSTPGKQASRRIAVLNKLFMRNITDLMSTGSIALEVLGRGIEISKVNITQDFQLVNVYWVCKGTEKDVETEKILNRVAGVLRHELSQLRLMGHVPTIEFVKDTQQAQILELNKRLAAADYGENYQPTELGQLLKSELSLETKLSPEIKQKIELLEEDLEDICDLPEMTHNVYGLDHAKIINRLLGARAKNEEAWERAREPVISSRCTDTERETICENNNYDNNKRDLALFLKKRQILQNKIYKDMVRAKLATQYSLEVERQFAAGNEILDKFDDFLDGVGENDYDEEYDFKDNSHLADLHEDVYDSKSNTHHDESYDEYNTRDDKV